MSKKQFVWIMTDTTRYDMLGCYGNPAMRTPNLDALAAQANLSTSRYIHLFTEIHHTSPLKFLNNIRMNMARELLSTCKLGVSEVAAMCGFQSPQYFCRMFRKATGMTPTQYRDQDAGDDS